MMFRGSGGGFAQIHLKPRRIRRAARLHAEVLPKLVGARLIHKIDVGESVSIDIRDGETIAVIVVNGLVVQAGIVHGPVHKGNPAGGQAILKTKVVKHLELS